MLALLLGVTLHAQTPANPEDVDPHFQVPPILKIGAQAPNFNLPDIDGKSHILKEYASSKVLVIVFTCNHCPMAQMYEERIKKLASDFHDRGVAVVAIMPNDPRALQVSELRHSDMSDTLAELKIRAAYRRFTFPYLYDGATQSVALMYGPTATPHVFIFDEQRKLRYQGRIASNPREERATKHEARDAIEDLLADRRITVENTPAVGCSTKWAYKEANAAQEITETEHKPVHLEMAGVDRMKTGELLGDVVRTVRKGVLRIAEDVPYVLATAVRGGDGEHQCTGRKAGRVEISKRAACYHQELPV